MVQPQGTNAGLQGSGMMEVDQGADEPAPEGTEPETSDRNSGMFVRQTSLLPWFSFFLLVGTSLADRKIGPEHQPSPS